MTRSKDRQVGKKARRSPAFARQAQSGNFLIVTDGEHTEGNYFTGLRDYLKNQGRESGVTIKVANTPKLIDTCIRELNVSNSVMEPWIVFDRDQVPNFDAIIKNAQKEDIRTAWSNPCFEIWLWGYFNRMPNFQSSVECCRAFGRKYTGLTGRDYEKNIPDIYSFLLKYGNEENAMRIAGVKRKEVADRVRMDKHREPFPSELCPSTMVDELVKTMKGSS